MRAGTRRLENALGAEVWQPIVQIRGKGAKYYTHKYGDYGNEDYFTTNSTPGHAVTFETQDEALAVAREELVRVQSHKWAADPIEWDAEED